MWANDLVNTNRIDELEQCLGPPSHMIHLFKIKPPDSFSSITNNRTNANNMVIRALQEVMRVLNEQIKQIEIYEMFLLEDNEWVQETQSSRLYADAITAQEEW